MNVKMWKIALIVSTLWLASAAEAAFITVNTADDELNNDGDCSLREAVRSANENSAFDACTAGGITTDSIFVAVNGTIVLDGAIVIEERVDIFGLGPNATVLDAGISRHMVVDMPDDTHDFDLSGMALVSGFSSSPGGAVNISRAGSVRLENVRFENNQGARGGAVGMNLPLGDEGSLQIVNCDFVENSSVSRGGALYIEGLPNYQAPTNLKIERSRFEANESVRGGGAIGLVGLPSVIIESSEFTENFTDKVGLIASHGGAVYWSALTAGASALMTIRDSLFDRNIADSRGGAISVFSGSTLIENSTLTRDRSGRTTSFGNAIAMFDGATLALIHSTLVDHDQIDDPTDSVIFIGEDSVLALYHTVIWTDGSSGINECDTSSANALALSNGYNFDTGGACTSQPTDTSGVDPQLWPLGDYGDAVNGRTLRTFLPRPDSPLIDGGQDGPCAGGLGAALTVDARGVTRPLDGDAAGGAQCDPGAVEFDRNLDPIGKVINVNILGAGGGSVSSDPAGLDCPGNCGEFFIDDSTVELFAQPDPGFVFTGWAGDCSGTGTCQVVMDANRNVSASFAVAVQPLSVSIVGSGTVASNPGGIVCPGTCSTTFVEGNIVELTPLLDPGFELASWGGDCSGTGSCMVTMDQPRNVTATFESTQVPLAVRFEGPGTGRVTSTPAGIDCTSNCSASFPPSTTVELAATPDVGNTFQNWTGACGGTSTCSVDVEEATSLGAVFIDEDALFIDSFE